MTPALWYYAHISSATFGAESLKAATAAAVVVVPGADVRGKCVAVYRSAGGRRRLRFDGGIESGGCYLVQGGVGGMYKR